MMGKRLLVLPQLQFGSAHSVPTSLDGCMVLTYAWLGTSPKLLQLLLFLPTVHRALLHAEMRNEAADRARAARHFRRHHHVIASSPRALPSGFAEVAQYTAP